jgi:hypothetical protein
MGRRGSVDTSVHERFFVTINSSPDSQSYAVWLVWAAVCFVVWVPLPMT